MLTLILIVAGYMDLRYRKIPNYIILLLFIYAAVFSTIPAVWRICGFVLTALPLFTLAVMTDRIKGGDVKFLTMLAASVGIAELAQLLAITTVLAVVWSAVKNENSVPLAFCTLLGWIMLCGIRLV